ncbi:MAG TPA: D-glycerate dehydrogenase [Azospirillaceae bacterium]|nr:D-glycerate dehydrogenase [Azospirillaceae bacterium]
MIKATADGETRSRPRLLLTRRLPPSVEARAGQDYDAHPSTEDRPLYRDALVRVAEGMDAILACAADRLPAEVIMELPESVRIIATFSVGTDHIHLDAAKRRGIVVTNTPDVLTDATADIALLLMLGAARRASEGDRMIRENAWSGWTPTQMLGIQVTGKRLGILGMGRIGQAVAQRARAFGMCIHYSNRNRLPAALEQGAVFHADPETMLPYCDFLSLHCPLTPETFHWLDARRIALLPDQPVVMNTARGAVVDDEALIEALRNGRVAAAGLDVFDNEPNLHPDYRTLSNTFLLPHLGSATMETRDAMGFRALDNLDAFFSGREPGDRVA